jgi:hypothetical protein
MYSESPARMPYVDWTLDRWKIGVILALFVGLIIASLTEPPDSVAVQLPAETLPISIPTSEASAVDPSPEEDETLPELALVPQSLRPAQTLRFPLTLASLGPNAIVPPNSVSVLFGSSASGSTVEVHDQVLERVVASDLSSGSSESQLLGRATANADGLWQLALAEPLAAGQHILTLQELGTQGELTAVSAPLVVTVLATGEQGPLALATPIIRSPALGEHLSPGTVEFSGTGLPGVVVRLYLNGTLVAQGVVTTLDEWQIVPAADLEAGVYLAQVTAVNPQGDVLAESAPVVFLVEEEPAQSSLPLTLPSPSLPLTISGLVFGDRRRTSLMVNGFATPQSAIAAWLEGRMIKATNAALDGRWSLLLEDATGFDEDQRVEVVSNFGERVLTDSHRQRPVMLEMPTVPLLLSPRAGEVLTTRLPLLRGVAPAEMDVVILVNRQVVAYVRANAEGDWAFHFIDPLPTGAVSLAVGQGAEARPEKEAAPVMVVVAPNP